MVCALAVAVLLAVPAAAQVAPGPALVVPRAVLDDPATPSPFAIGDPETAAPKAKKRGVIAGIDIGADAAFGFGVFSAAPKPSLSTADQQSFGGPRKSRKAGVGLSLKF